MISLICALVSGLTRTLHSVDNVAGIAVLNELLDSELGLISRSVPRQRAFERVGGSLTVDVRTSERLAAAALKIFVSTNDFTALHGVTGLEALSQLRPYVHDVARFDRSSFQALAAAYLSIGAPNVWSGHRLQDLVMSEELDMLSVARCAANSDDAHVAKFVYSALRLGRTTGYPLYFVVAHRAVERRDPGSHRGSTMHRVTSEIGEVSPYFYPNKRIVLWGRRG